MTTTPLETRYAGCRFRSRLEARWAVFFDTLGIKWEYEPQGFLIPHGNGAPTPYLPDFLLPACGTWIEVKGSEGQLDRGLIEGAAIHLPDVGTDGVVAPRLLLLGPIPEPPDAKCDLGWLGLTGYHDPDDDMPEPYFADSYWGFGGFDQVLTLSQLDISSATTYLDYDGKWLEPCISYQSMNTFPGVPHAYRSARSARFEHGEIG